MDGLRHESAAPSGDVAAGAVGPGGASRAPGATAAMWGGRFSEPPDAVFRELNDSLPVDWRLVREDIAGSIVWAGALGGCGVLSSAEVTALRAALAELWTHAASLTRPPTESGAEDVHTWVEQRLVERLGSLGKKLHTGRSRNDQVATDFRLWTIGALGGLIGLVRGLRAALVGLAERSEGVAMPAYTHLQRAQPVLAAHWCLAYVEMLERDAERLRDAADRAAECPLGSGALAGTAYPVDREWIAARLGFERPTRNSLDAVSDRDFVFESLAAMTLCGLHISRLAEDLVIYATEEFGLVKMDDAVTSGSSLMPQKKNPDAAELLRAKSGRFVGALAGFAVVLKGLPLSYNKDLQEDKSTLFGAVDELVGVLRLATRLVEGTRFVSARCEAAASGGGASATDLADYLVSRGVPFREAHEIVGGVVRRALSAGRSLEQLSGEELCAMDPRIGADAVRWLTTEAILARRDAAGGTSRERVSAALAEARERLESPTAREVAALVRDPAARVETGGADTDRGGARTGDGPRGVYAQHQAE